MTRTVRALVLTLAMATLAGIGVPVATASAPSTEVVVTLDAPSLARAVKTSRVLTASVKRRRLDLASPTSLGYLRELAHAQQRVEASILRRIPGARVRWRYRVVANGLAVVVPAGQVARLAAIDGIRRVFPGAAYGTRLNDSTKEIGANEMWGLPSLSTAGNGVKIGIIDTGIDPQPALLQSRRICISARVSEGQPGLDDAKGDRRPWLRPSRRDREVRPGAVRSGELRPRRPRCRDRRRQSRRPRRVRIRDGVRRRASCVSRQLQGLQHGVAGLRADRELGGGRRGHRIGRARRNGRDQPLARGVRGQPGAQPRRCRDRRCR